MPRRSLPIFLLLAACLLAPPAPARGAGNGFDHFIHLPLIRRETLPPSGQVTRAGAPARGVTVTLRLFDGLGWSEVSAVSDLSGRFTFLDLPPGPARQYQVVWRSEAGDPALLERWDCRLADGPPAGSLCVFDIAAAGPLQPLPGPQSLPVLFRWDARGRPAGLYGLYFRPCLPGSAGTWTSGPLTAGDQYLLSALPAGLAPRACYYWSVVVYDPAGEGLSLPSGPISFP